MSTRATEAESVLKEHMGYLPVSEMERRGVSRTEISRFVREAKLEKSAKGLYVSPNAESDPLFELQYRYPKAIFSHETALFLLGEGERAPPDTDDYLTAIIRYGSSQERRRNSEKGGRQSLCNWPGVGYHHVRAYGSRL